ncbi:MAG: hypothetical protein CVT88_06545 [Candidatus Altiarchaeales archaeon HGW-Altiarchaeales-1]|nr:MAG: hypothetical protein CVT88_06545 [Candidatus Altiarchaeales archaeon HGW-Altiarchaeales-1]
MKTDIQSPNNIFIFNLGRLWQAASLDHWEDAMYLCGFIQEITPPALVKKYSKNLKKLQIAIEKEDCSAVDIVLEKILKW